MMKSKKCAICGYEFSYDNKFFESPYVQPHDDGARYYYNLWHFPIEQCPECGYASKDVAHTFNKKIVKDEEYQYIPQIDIVQELDGARPNRVSSFLKGAHYYRSIGDELNEIKSLLQAGDMVYGELMYWEDYVFDNSDPVSALISKTQSNEIKKFGDNLINSAMAKLESYIKTNPDDMDSQILYAGTLCDGDKLQEIKGAKLLSGLKNKDLNLEQKKALKFLLNHVN